MSKYLMEAMSEKLKKKREEIALAIERDQPNIDMGKKMAIATAAAKKALKEACEKAKKIADSHGIEDDRALVAITEAVLGEADYSAKKAAAGQDIGKKGKNFDKIADEASKRYGSKEAGEKVAGAVLNKLRGK